jgi:hypothetical protein
LRDLADIPRATLKLRDDLDRRPLSLRVALDGASRAGNPLSRIAEHDLHGLGASAQRICFAMRCSEPVKYPLDSRELLLGRAGGLLSARRDLLH